MGKRDLMTVDYLSEPAHFADMFNAALFQGKEVIKAEQLEEADKELADLDTDKGEGVRHDNVKKCFQNTQLALLVIEDQMHVDYHMILRNMFAESLHYRRQWKKRKKEHQIKKDLKPGNEFISGMKKGEVFTPVVLLVVYFGEEPWDGPRSLHELLNLSGENEKWRPFLNDYQLNLFDYHDYESFEKFRSGLRVIFEFLRYADDKNRLREIVAEHPDHYYNIKEDTYQMVAVLTKSRELLQKEKECINEDGGKNMCKALEAIREEGKEEGIKEGIKEGIQALMETCREFGKTREETLAKIIEKFSLTQETAMDYINEYWKEI